MSRLIIAIKSLSRFDQPQNVFLLIACVWGTLTVFVTPPFQVPDEQNHFLRAYQISTGKIFPETRDNLVGGYIPSSIIETDKLFSDIPFHPERKTNRENIRLSLHITLNPGLVSFAHFPNTALYDPVPYIPQSLSIITGRIFNASPLVILYLARLFNLICWIFLIFLAIRIIPFYKWLLILLALTPMSVFQASSASADVMTNGVTFLFTATIFKIAFTHIKSKGFDLVPLIILIVLLTLSKYAYFFLIILYFLIPINKPGTIRSHILKALPIFAIAGLTLSFCIYFVQHVYGTVDPSVNYFGDFPGWPKINPRLQTHYIFTHVSAYLKTLVFTLWESKGFILGSFIGNLGYLDTPLPHFYIVVAIIVLITIALTSGSKDISVNFKDKMVLITGFGCVIFSILTILYLSWNPVGSLSFSGFQGRYLIPLAPVVITLFYNQKWVIPERFIRLISFMFIAFSFLIMNYSLISRYYVSTI